MTRLPALLRGTETSNGGLKRELLKDVLVGRVPGLQFAPPGFASREIDLLVPERALAVSLQAGRAWTNNGALLAVLAAADAKDVRSLILFVPEHYKSGVQHAYVREQLQHLAAATGITLDLDGVLLLGF